MGGWGAEQGDQLAGSCSDWVKDDSGSDRAGENSLCSRYNLKVTNKVD